MTCPKCHYEKTRVTDTLPGDDGAIYRRRKCSECGLIFRTVEVIATGVYGRKFNAAERRKHERSKNGKNS